MQRLCRGWALPSLKPPSLFLVSIFPPWASHVIASAWPKSASGYIRVPQKCPLTSELCLLILSPHCVVFQSNCILSVKNRKKNGSLSRTEKPRWTKGESWKSDLWGNTEWAWIVLPCREGGFGENGNLSSNVWESEQTLLCSWKR